MNYALILIGGTGQRMKNKGMPKQFLEVYGKPIVVYTLEKFESNNNIDKIIIACNKNWINHMDGLSQKYSISKIDKIVQGGEDRQHSICNGLAAISEEANDDDIVVIHDGVRPLVSDETIYKNVFIARKYGNAMTVKLSTETAICADNDVAQQSNFLERDSTYLLTSPQSFKLKELKKVMPLMSVDAIKHSPVLDPAILLAQLGDKIHLVKEGCENIKITTPEDYYYLRAILEYYESKNIFGM